MKLYFVRHGESEANIVREISNRGWRHPLTEKGKSQAALLGETLRDCGAVKIYTSPLMRAVQTAQILSEKMDIDYEITGALREYDCGLIEGRADSAAWDLWAWARAEWFIHGRLGSMIEGGESFQEMLGRFLPLVNSLVREYGESPANFILVGHGGLYTCVLPPVLGGVTHAEVSEKPFPNTAYVLAEVRAGRLVGLSWCGTALIETSPSGE